MFWVFSIRISWVGVTLGQCLKSFYEWNSLGNEGFNRDDQFKLRLCAYNPFLFCLSWQMAKIVARIYLIMSFVFLSRINSTKTLKLGIYKWVSLSPMPYDHFTLWWILVANLMPFQSPSMIGRVDGKESSWISIHKRRCSSPSQGECSTCVG